MRVVPGTSPRLGCFSAHSQELRNLMFLRREGARRSRRTLNQEQSIVGSVHGRAAQMLSVSPLPPPPPPLQRRRGLWRQLYPARCDWSSQNLFYGRPAVLTHSSCMGPLCWLQLQLHDSRKNTKCSSLQRPTASISPRPPPTHTHSQRLCKIEQLSECRSTTDFDQVRRTLLLPGVDDNDR